MSLDFRLKPDDAPAPVPVSLRRDLDALAAGIALTEMARALRDDLQVHRDRLTRRSTDPLATLSKAQGDAVELFDAGARVLDTVEEMMMALRRAGAFSATYSGRGQ